MANINPIRYRGYYFDAESGFYYLGSRYYDPAICRFINADGYVDTNQGLNSTNMFSYCGNNPINRKDPTGEIFIAAVIIAVATLAIAALSGCSSKPAPTSNVGAAKPFVPMAGSSDPTSPNCYAYAVGASTNKQPGGSSGKTPKRYDSVKSVGASVIADLEADGFTVRKISGPDDKVYENEFKIALAVGTKPYAYDVQGNLYYDYHFMVQTDTGQWAEKHGTAGDAILWDEGMTPDTIPWTLFGEPYYDDGPVYYAIGR